MLELDGCCSAADHSRAMQTNEDTIFPKETSHTVKVSVGVEASKEQLVINEVVAFDVGSADSGQNNEA